MKFRPLGSAPRDVNAPRATTEVMAYRLCQPMHVLSFGEGRKEVFFGVWRMGLTQQVVNEIL